MAQSTTTVTVANVTPPTNFSFLSYGSPPSPPGSPFVDDGTAGPTTAIAAPTSGPVCEASGTVVVNTTANNTTSVTVMGNYTNTPNGQHASSLSPSAPMTITGLVPPSVVSGGGTQALAVNGTGFTSQSVIVVNGVAQVTSFISSVQINAAAVPKKATAGTLPVTVVTGGVTTAPTNWTFT
jgi:hypothetical protein